MLRAQQPSASMPKKATRCSSSTSGSCRSATRWKAKPATPKKRTNVRATSGSRSSKTRRRRLQSRRESGIRADGRIRKLVPRKRRRRSRQRNRPTRGRGPRRRSEKGKVFALLTDPREGGLVDENDTAAGQLLAFNTSNLTPAGRWHDSSDRRRETAVDARDGHQGRQRTRKGASGPAGDHGRSGQTRSDRARPQLQRGAKTDPLSYTAKAGSEPADHYVLRRINEETGALEGRYEEKTGVLGERTGKNSKKRVHRSFVPENRGTEDLRCLRRPRRNPVRTSAGQRKLSTARTTISPGL